MYEGYKDRVNFTIIYLREAHPSDGWQMPQNEKDGVEFNQPTTTEERIEVAGTCVKDLKLSLPCLIDNLEDQANKVYCGWPDRFYVIEKGGKVAFQGGIGPQGFKPDEADAVIRKLVGDPKGR